MLFIKMSIYVNLWQKLIDKNVKEARTNEPVTMHEGLQAVIAIRKF